MFDKFLNMPLVLIVGKEDGFGYFYRIKDFPVQKNSITNFSKNSSLYRVSQKKLYIILNRYKWTLRHAIWKIFLRYRKLYLRNVFAKFRSDITTLSVFIEIWIYQVK